MRETLWLVPSAAGRTEVRVYSPPVLHTVPPDGLADPWLGSNEAQVQGHWSKSMPKGEPGN
ncbi:MAG: hypothetical protein NTU91_03215 [Chloroflexi bacterium]|nr:hypothetical protein [Chloroflexota bacterium]